MGFGPIPVQEELLNNGVRAKPRSRRITEQLGFGPIPVQEESLNSGVGANPRFKKNNSTVEVGLIPVQGEPLNGLGLSPFKNNSTVGFRPNPYSRRTGKQWGSAIPIQEEPVNNGVRPSPFKKNHLTVGFRPVPVQEESLNSGVQTKSPFKKNQ